MKSSDKRTWHATAFCIMKEFIPQSSTSLHLCTQFRMLFTRWNDGTVFILPNLCLVDIFQIKICMFWPSWYLRNKGSRSDSVGAAMEMTLRQALETHTRSVTGCRWRPGCTLLWPLLQPENHYPFPYRSSWHYCICSRAYSLKIMHTYS